MTQAMVVQVCFGTGNGCSGVLWHRHCLFRCYGIGIGCSGVLWHGNWLFRCIMAQEMVIRSTVAQELVAQLCYGTETGCDHVFWHRNRLNKMCYCTEKGHMMTTTNFHVP